MEDYRGACSARYLDVDTLLNSVPQRSVAALHLGGIAVECQIKAMVLAYHGITIWSQSGCRKRDPYYGKPVVRPGHRLLATVKLMTHLFEKAKTDRLFMKHLDQVMHPSGSNADFIDLRYEATDLDAGTVKAWQTSLKYVNGWLKKNEVT